MNELQKAIAELLKTKPYYAHFFLNSTVIMDWGNIPTAAAVATNKGTLFVFNSKFLESLKYEEIIAIIEHEVLHFLFEHVYEMKREEPQDNHIKNIAMDVAINQYINHIPEGACTVESIEKILKRTLLREQTWEYYYDELKKEQEKMKGQKTLDEHDVGHPDEVKGDRARAAIKSTADKALKASRGIAPREILKALDSLNSEPKLPWKQILSNFVARATSSDRVGTRKRRNRRYGVSVPGVKKKRELILAVCVDSSGSISDEAYVSFMNEISRISKLVTKTHVIEADCEVHNVETLKKGKPPTMERRSMGGTAYQPAINKAVELKADAIIYFGDFDTSDKPENPGKPFLWVGVGRQDPPADFGEVVRL